MTKEAILPLRRLFPLIHRPFFPFLLFWQKFQVPSSISTGSALILDTRETCFPSLRPCNLSLPFTATWVRVPRAYPCLPVNILLLTPLVFTTQSILSPDGLHSHVPSFLGVTETTVRLPQRIRAGCRGPCPLVSFSEEDVSPPVTVRSCHLSSALRATVPFSFATCLPPLGSFL